MANNGQVTWNATVLREHTRDGSVAALNAAGKYGHGYWDQIVPVSSDKRTHGQLKESWDDVVDALNNTIILTISANTRFAIYVELGTYKMTPRAPLRNTAGAITAILPQYIFEQLKIA